MEKVGHFEGSDLSPFSHLPQSMNYNRYCPFVYGGPRGSQLLGLYSVNSDKSGS